MQTISKNPSQVRHSKRTADPLLLFGEYLYYAIIAYGLMGGALGIRVRLLGAGLLVALGILCLLRLGPQVIIMNKSLAYPLGCAVSFTIVQVIFHSESLQIEIFKALFLWIMGLIVIHALFLRKGFFIRFALACFLIGLCLLPYLSNVTPNNEYERFGLDQSVGLSNPNVLGEWFGFCGVVFFIIGLETKILVVRMLSWVGTFVCVFVISLTISRGSLLAVVICIIIASRHFLKRGLFFALLLVCLGSWLVYESGVFEKAIANYTVRASEESGRFTVWPLVVERVFEFPFTGVGLSEVKTLIPSKGKAITPHNGFLYLALVSGVVPVAFFVAYWVRASFGVWRTYLPTRKHRLTDASFRLPLFVYAFLSNFTTNTSYMVVWMMVILTMVSADPTSSQIRHLKESDRGK